MRIIELESWDRRDHYRWYRDYAAPHLAITAEVDFTGLVEERAGRSLFSEVMWALTEAANGVAPFRQRVRVVDGADQIVEHAAVHPAFTVGLPGDRFGFAMVERTGDPAAFAAAVRAASEEAQRRDGLAPFDSVRDDLMYLSCLPWVRFTHVEHPVRDVATDFTPRISWGRMVESGGRWTAPVNVKAHHSLVDGAHLGRFFERLVGVVG